MNISLVMVQPDGSMKEFPVPRLPAVIGRDESCRIRVPLASVSRRHCELIESDDELIVRDLKSSNGTYINGERVRQREVVPGDLLALGPVVFVVRIDGFPKDIDAADSYAAGAVPVGGGAPGAGGAPTAIAGVPTWGGSGGGGGGGGAAPADAPTAGSKSENKDDDDLGDLLEGLDLDEDEDEK